MHGISYRPTDLSLLKEFSKKTVLKIFIILFEQDCPEAVVHGLSQLKVWFALVVKKINTGNTNLAVGSHELLKNHEKKLDFFYQELYFQVENSQQFCKKLISQF